MKAELNKSYKRLLDKMNRVTAMNLDKLLGKNPVAANHRKLSGY